MNSSLPMRSIKHIHFIGIGGSGMSGIAEVLLTEGYHISGSDKNDSANTNRLRELGASIYLGHHPSQVDAVDVVVVSSAIDKDNPEYVAAKEQRIPIVGRAEMLAELMRFRQGIAVAGTHGKTTTTSLIASLLAEADLDPTFVIGGLLNSAGANAKLGTGKYLVAEADESDASFLYLQPTMAVVTNIDADHMGQYQGDMNCLRETFNEFLHHLPFYGLAVLCIDDDNVKQVAKHLSRPVITYGFDNEADIYASDFQQQGLQSEFVLHRKGKKSINITLNMAGKHNVLNALAAIAIAMECGVSDNALQSALQKFAGVGRRLQLHGEYDVPQGKVLLLDDYGHHPKELAVTLEAIRDAWPARRIVSVFQPHRYSRTHLLFDDFVEVLSGFDQLLLMEVYAAGEEVIPSADSRALCRAIRTRGQLDPVFIGSEKTLYLTLARILKDGDILLLQGAGSIGQTLKKILAKQLNWSELSDE